ncbi:MAG: hypothetical protein JWM80_3830, partial [Cyanobacteria bacterium RYN_339]|nr:hypothetical protein [Cyanobacteria bacterium RYN_339]
AGDAAAGRAAQAEAEALIAARGLEFLRKQDAALWLELAATAPAAVPAPEGMVVKLFGELELLRGDVRVDDWPRRKAKLLLAALALYPRGLSLVELAEILADGQVGQAAVMIVQTNVSALRRVLGGEQAKAAIPFADERYRVAEGLLAGCDVWTFEQAARKGLALRDTRPMDAVAPLEQALACYRDNLLAEPFFERYFEAERERLRQQALACLYHLAAARSGLGDFAGAEADLQRATQLAPTEWEAYRRVMEHQAERKRPDQVRQAYWDYRKALKSRLRVVPDEACERAFKEALGSAEA